MSWRRCAGRTGWQSWPNISGDTATRIYQSKPHVCVVSMALKTFQRLFVAMLTERILARKSPLY